LRHVADRIPHLGGVARNIVSVDQGHTAGGARSVMSTLMVVDFPAPFGPRNAKISPASTANDIIVNRGEMLERLYG